MAKQKNDGEYEDYVEYKKASKKEKRRRDNEQRNTWDINPCERVEPDKTKYTRRKKHKKDDYYEEY